MRTQTLRRSPDHDTNAVSTAFLEERRARLFAHGTQTHKKEELAVNGYFEICSER
jgi:hypothetical protein